MFSSANAIAESKINQELKNLKGKIETIEKNNDQKRAYKTSIKYQLS